MKKKLISRRAFTPTTVYLKIQDIADNPKYNISLDEVQKMVADRDSNGLCDCGVQIGRRFFIDQEKFEKWKELQSASSAM